MSDASHRGMSNAAPASVARTPNANRRRFLMAFGAGAAGAASAPVLAAAPAALVEAEEPKQSLGYTETDHVRNYYATTRL